LNPLRLAGLIMVMVGVALFVTFSGFLASTFLWPRKAKQTAPDLAELRALPDPLGGNDGATARQAR
jgi:hypothetical protein